MYRKGLQLSSVHVMLALTAGLLTVACTQGADGPVRSVAYYRSHPAGWERRVWVCTNDPGSFEQRPGCTAARLALRSEGNDIESSGAFTVAEGSPIRR